MMSKNDQSVQANIFPIPQINVIVTSKIDHNLEKIFLKAKFNR